MTRYTDDGSADPAADGMLAGLVAGTVYRYAVAAYLDGENEGDPPLRGDWSEIVEATAAAPTLVLSETALTVNENASDTYTVALSRPPSAAVTVAVSSGAAGTATVAPAALTFTTGNWGTAQTVTVTGVDDALDNANDQRAVTLTHSASGYADAEVSVTVTDDDTRGVTLSVTSLTVLEGTSGTYTVKLASQPTASVTVTVGGAAGDVTADTDTGTTGNQNILTFTTTNWGTAQTVTVAAADDDDAAADAAVTLTHTVAGGDYGSVTAGSVTVTITEKDAATFSVTGPTSIGEGAGTATYTVALSARPDDDVTVKYATADGTATAGSDYTAASGTLTFTTTNWDTDQTVDVAITDDAVDDDDETFTFTLSEPGTGTSLSASPSVTTTITDDDTAAPAKPAGFEVEAGYGQATLSWDDPDNADIDKWQYSYKEGTGAFGSWTDVPDSSATTTEHTITGLKNGTAHTFKVRAVADGTEGAESEEKSATPTLPAPTGLTAATPGPAGIALSWTAPAGVTLSGYNIYRCAEGRV